MASFPLYDTFFYYFTQKSSLFVQLFRKKWEKIGHPQKSCLTPPLIIINCSRIFEISHSSIMILILPFSGKTLRFFQIIIFGEKSLSY